MKLLWCPQCHDLFKLHRGSAKACTCSKSKGNYNPDGDTATVYGKGVVIGLLNDEFCDMIMCSDHPPAKVFLYPKDNGKITYLK